MRKYYSSLLGTPSRSIYWIVVGITFLTLLVSAGIRSTPGVLIVPFEQSFGWTRAEVTFPIAINLALYGLCGPFAAAFMKRYGVKRIMIIALSLLVIGTSLSTWLKMIWQMTVLWGFIVGIGAGLTSSVLGAVVANRWFKEKRGFIIGVFTASGATGQLVFLPLFAKIVSSYGWQMVVWVTALFAMIVVLLVGLFMRDKPSDAGILPYGETESLKTESTPHTNPFLSAIKGLKIGIRSKDFWLLMGSFFVCGLSTNGLIGTHLIPACMEHGITEVTAASMLAFMGIFDIVGTTLSGWLSDRWNNRWLLFWYYGLRGISLVFLPYALGSTFLGLAIFVVFYGLDWVATVPPTIRLCNDVFGKQSGIVFGWVWASHQLGAATAAFGSGIIRTWFGTYTFIFIVAGILCVTAAGFVLQINKRNKSIIPSV
ncbi:Sugar phosphate permease [Seinonella peptonophila]|uniref:Sugar phosphate permease n=1 Tax=Seinonella peptonophila TaxID=112248 RepID=A0A1M4YPX8_9BACL|nr:MFS transporter [Seinonella peptonophila]SHF07718.1 Sugar phosphate permease [Seinonella peptonophila]